ncbi:MAG: AAA family ATPase [Dehalococcoidales bacterium]|nr:AAA family ATPase [Dehalococcoidales bacterium]
MAKVKQLSLFDLTPRDKDKVKINLSKGGISELQVKNFKGIGDLSVTFDPITLLVGANNSGKSTLLQATRLFYYCIEKCGSLHSNEKGTLKKQVMPFSNFSLIPAHTVKELITNGVTPSSRKHGIYLYGKLRSGLIFDFNIYSAYSTLFVILPGEKCPRRISKTGFDSASRQPLYVPGFSGVVTKELLSTNRTLEELLGSGHHNEVLRNLILRLRPNDIEYLSKILSNEFSVKFQGIKENPNNVEFLKAAYREASLRIPLDIVSAGAGFLQVLQILTHALQSPSPILLLDEPDAHMHTQLQEHFINLLREFSKDRKMQIIMASHSETFTRTMELSEIRLIDRKSNRSESFTDPVIMKSELSSFGVWPDEPKLTEALRIKRVLLCESSPDHDLLCAFANNCTENWHQINKQYEMIETKGTNDNVVARMQSVVEVLNKLLNGTLVAYLRDRDLMCDERKAQIEKQSSEKGLNLIVTERRNRESYLIEPVVVESAVLSQIEKVPNEWQRRGFISELVKGWCIEFCESQIDELQSKILEYNQGWLRNAFTDPSERRDATTRLNTFIRVNWIEQIRSHEIPWKLMDGFSALSYIRSKLQEKSILLSDLLLLKHLVAAKVPGEFFKLIRLIKSWN